MQSAASRQPNPNFKATSTSRSTLIAILALFLFALSGLMTGFATGAFTRTKQTAQQNTNNTNNSKTNSSGKTAATPVQTQNPHVTQTPNVGLVGLGCPAAQYMLQEVQGGSYSVQAQTLDGSGGCGYGNLLHTAGITCRLWLTKDDHFSNNIPKDRIKSINTLQDAFPKEEEGALNFTNGTTSVQPCNPQGATVWNYQLSPSLDAGKYYLMVLVDWKGILYNWSARAIKVTKAD